MKIHNRMFEMSFESDIPYDDPFNELEVDVLFVHGERKWRVPAFWRGGQRWTVRFAPPIAGNFSYRVECSDADNPGLNDIAGSVRIDSYEGPFELFRRGPLRVADDRRRFVHVDGSPFFWLGDTWWTGLSTRWSWDDFRLLTDDRRQKGFTVIQLVAGLVPHEEHGPLDPGFCNEGGSVWEEHWERINPAYFDAADRRILHLLEHGMLPAIVGAWSNILDEIGPRKICQHWRYIIARFGAFPVVWVSGGEVKDMPDDEAARFPASLLTPGWTDVTAYIRRIDPYRHPLTVHEVPPPRDAPLRDESITDFEMLQSGHRGWATNAFAVAALTMRQSRTTIRRPVVQGEIGYEKLGETHLEDFQRAAFWLSMLNGAAGHTYGANGVFEAYDTDKPLHRARWSFMTWQEGMKLPGAYQISIGAKLLRSLPWWLFEPRPDWVTPAGTTLFDPIDRYSGYELGATKLANQGRPGPTGEYAYPGGAWAARNGTVRLPYAAGAPGIARIVYIPGSGLIASQAPTIVKLERGIRYQAYFWDPTNGARLDLGGITRPEEGALLFDDARPREGENWAVTALNAAADYAETRPLTSALLYRGLDLSDCVVSVELGGDSDAGLLVRYSDPDNWLAVRYSTDRHMITIIDRTSEKSQVSQFPMPDRGCLKRATLEVEARGDKITAQIVHELEENPIPILDVQCTNSGRAGLLLGDPIGENALGRFTLRRNPNLDPDPPATREVHDAEGRYRGTLEGKGMNVWGGFFQSRGWSAFGRDKHLLLGAYRPEILPTIGDWILVLDARAPANRTPRDTASAD